jgi:hypothetical protein
MGMIGLRGVIGLGRFGLVGEILLELFAGFEIRDTLGRNIDRLSRLWVSATAGTTLSCAETTEPAQLDFFSPVKGRDYRVEDRFDNNLGIALIKFRRARHFFHEFCLSHL